MSFDKQWSKGKGTIVKAQTPEHDFVDVDLLWSDSTYQPKLDLRRVHRMAAHVDWNLIGLIVVNERELGSNVYQIVDGQHRVAMLRMAREEMAPCEIHRGLTLKEEADLFVKLQQLRRSRLVSGDMYRALRAAGDPNLQAFERAVASSGLTVSLSAAGKTTVKGTKGLVDFTERFGEHRMRAALTALNKAWPESEIAHQTRMIEGAVIYAVCFPESIETCAGRWRHTDPKRVGFNAAHIRETEGGRTFTVFAKALAHAHNLRARVNRVDPTKVNLVTIRSRDNS